MKRIIFSFKKEKNLNKPLWILCFDQEVGPETSWEPSDLNYPMIYFFLKSKKRPVVGGYSCH